VIREAKQTKEDRHQQHNPKEDAEREQRRQIEGKEWKKFGRQSATIKSVRVPREKIARCLYRGATLHSGIGTLMVDVAWKDNRLTRGALMLITRLEDFMRLRKLRPGEPVPEELWAKGPMVELGIIQRVAGGGAFPGKDIGRKKAQEKQVQAPQKPGLLRSIGVIDGKGKTNWGLVALYAFLIALATMAIVIALT
jgi:hypothetical protein